MINMGPTAGQTHTFNEKPAANASISWVKQSHSFKFGWDYFALAIPQAPYTNTNGLYSFSPNQTALPYLVGSSGAQTVTGGTTGFGYASFLMGQVDSYQIAAPAVFRDAKQQNALYAQDSWKATRKLTLTYGVRWDYGTYFREEHGRAINFSPSTPNPAVGGMPGAFIYEGDGPGLCNCTFAKNYPWAFGPRVGGAYQITPKTVLRVGWGIVYGPTSVSGAGLSLPGFATSAVGSSPGLGKAATTLQAGIPITPVWPNFTPGVLPFSSLGNQALPTAPYNVGYFDPGSGRPPRQNEWSIGIEREITGNLVVEASYVANRGVWWAAPSLRDLNGISQQRLASYHLDLSDPNDQALLLQPLSSSAAIARGFQAPYPGFSTRLSVAQAIRPFPQFANIPVIGNADGKTWYDSLQLKVTKRLSHGLNLGTVFTWQKSLQEGVDGNPNLSIGSGQYVNNVLANPHTSKSISRWDQPYVFIFTGSYQLPKWAPTKALGYALKDWQIGALMQYASGLPIPTPASTGNLANQIFQPTLADRVPGQPLYNVDFNCHCFDPSTNFILNKDAWAIPASGKFGNAAQYYSDYRYQRHPQESMNIGRTFHFKERVSLNLQMGFSNVFNRTYLADTNLSVTNPFVNQTKVNGQTTGGFGFLSRALTGTQFGQPRVGTLIARFIF
jgi:hypothetical protein